MTPKHAEKPPDDELTPDDIAWIRRQRKLDEHAAWLRGQVRVIWPWAVSVVGALVAALMWIRDHVRF